MDFRIARIPKGKREFREIYIVSDSDKKLLRAELPYLEERLLSLDKQFSNYAFQKGRNCALNALQHIGSSFLLSLDLEKFFDNITKAHVADLIDQRVIDLCFINGAPRQGLPTSPIIATIAFLRCDTLIHEALKKLRIDAVYTRYADDLAFSFNRKTDGAKIQTVVSQIVEKQGYSINKYKTCLQDIRNGRFIITGVGVDGSGLHPTRRVRKRLRAARHQNNATQLAGLTEWSKCKLPNDIVS